MKACVDSALQLGLPEARLPLADAAVLMATAPKSNSAHNAILAAEQDLRPGQNRPGAPPAAEQAFRRRGRGAKGAELSVPARLSGPLGEAAVPAGRAGGRALLRIRTKQKRAGREGLLGQNQEVRARQAGAEAGRAPPAPAARAAGGRREQAREIRFLEKYNE